VRLRRVADVEPARTPSSVTICIGSTFDDTLAGVGLKAPNCLASQGRSGVITSRQSPADRLAGLDGLRAVAVVAVLLFHAGVGSVPGGFLGVDLFFVISGFLITSILLAEFKREGRLSLRDFYVRRARRLLPALVAMLAVVAGFMALFFRGDLIQARGDIAAALGYVSNWWYVLHHRSYFVAAGRPEPLQHLWSLAVEEQFYLVWPVVLGGLLLLRARLRWVAAVALAGALASTLFMRSIAIRGNVPFDTDSSRVYFGTDTHASALLLGAAAAAVIAGFAGRASRPGRAVPAAVRAGLDVVGLGALGAVCWSMHSVSYYSPALYRGGFLAFAALAVVVVVSASTRGGWLGLVLDVPPLRWLGARSYGLYLWHWPVFVYTRPGIDWPLHGSGALTARLAITVLLTELSYRLVELPLRHRRGIAFWRPLSGSWRVVAPVLGSVAGVVAVVGATAYGAARVSAQSAGNHRVAAVPASERPAAPIAPRASAASTTPPPPTSAAPATSPSAPVSPPPLTHAPPPPAHSAHSAAVVAVPVVAAPAVAATPPAIPAGAPPSVSAVGDSVLLDAEATLVADCPGTEVYAVVGWQAKAVFAQLAALRAAGHLGTDVVIETGTNGIVSGKELDAVLTSLADRRQVVVVNDHMNRPWEPPNNAMFAAVVKAHANAVLVDWDAAANAHQDWLSTDDVHLKPAGRAPYAALIRSAAGC
jgi:peptidoglycan/LPS O-acetylase OafA/YrhL